MISQKDFTCEFEVPAWYELFAPIWCVFGNFTTCIFRSEHFWTLWYGATLRYLKKPSKEPRSQVGICMGSCELWAISGFSSQKSELSRDFDTWSIFRAEIKEKLNGSNFELSQDPMQIPTCDLGSFDGFLSYLKVPPPRIWFSLYDIIMRSPWLTDLIMKSTISVGHTVWPVFSRHHVNRNWITLSETFLIQ